MSNVFKSMKLDYYVYKRKLQDLFIVCIFDCVCFRDIYEIYIYDGHDRSAYYGGIRHHDFFDIRKEQPEQAVRDAAA